MAGGSQILSALGKLFISSLGKRDICEDCCGLDDCGCSPSDTNPRVKMTLTWTDTDTTKSYLTCTWANGESKEICATAHVTNATKETWKHSVNAGHRLELVARSPAGSQKDQRVQCVGSIDAYHRFVANVTYNTNTSLKSTGVTTWIPALTLLSPATAIGGTIAAVHFGQCTTTSGITIKWERLTPAQASGPGTPGYWKVSAP